MEIPKGLATSPMFIGTWIAPLSKGVYRTVSAKYRQL